MSLATFWRCFAARFPKDANAVSSVASPIDSPGVFACAAATVASSGNASDERPISERRQRAPAQPTAAQHGDDGAVAQPQGLLDRPVALPQVTRSDYFRMRKLRT
jgi:hypothetical protein